MQVVPVVLLFNLRLALGVIVKTDSGFIRGFRIANDASVFEGIPFAEPPIGPLRFKRPRAVLPWAPGILNASRALDGCASEETCLRLSVFTPLASFPVSSGVLPVAVFAGAETLSAKSAYAAFLQQGIVVVVGQRRDDVLGFFDIGRRALDSNVALWDVVAVLRWIRANIGHFGGDSGRVTLLGSGSSAAVASALLYAGPSAALFQQAVLLDGSVLSPSAWSRNRADDNGRLAAALVERLGCSAHNLGLQLACLRSTPAAKLGSLSALLQKQLGLSWHFQVGDSDGLLPYEPWDLLSNWGGRHGVLIGVSSPKYAERTEKEAKFQVASRSLLRANFPPQFHRLLAPMLRHEFDDADKMIRSYEIYGPVTLEAQAMAGNAYKSVHFFSMEDASADIFGTLLPFVVRFIRTGDPNPTGQGPWPRLRSGLPHPACLRITPSTAAMRPDCRLPGVDFWNGLVPEVLSAGPGERSLGPSCVPDPLRGAVWVLGAATAAMLVAVAAIYAVMTRVSRVAHKERKAVSESQLLSVPSRDPRPRRKNAVRAASPFPIAQPAALQLA